MTQIKLDMISGTYDQVLEKCHVGNKAQKIMNSPLNEVRKFRFISFTDQNYNQMLQQLDECFDSVYAFDNSFYLQGGFEGKIIPDMIFANIFNKENINKESTQAINPETTNDSYSSFSFNYFNKNKTPCAFSIYYSEKDPALWCAAVTNDLTSQNDQIVTVFAAERIGLHKDTSIESTEVFDKIGDKLSNGAVKATLTGIFNPDGTINPEKISQLNLMFQKGENAAANKQSNDEINSRNQTISMIVDELLNKTDVLKQCISTEENRDQINEIHTAIDNAIAQCNNFLSTDDKSSEKYLLAKDEDRIQNINNLFARFREDTLQNQAANYDVSYNRLIFLLAECKNHALQQKIQNVLNQIKAIKNNGLILIVDSKHFLAQTLNSLADLLKLNASKNKEFDNTHFNDIKKQILNLIPLEYEAQTNYLDFLLADSDINRVKKTKIEKLYNYLKEVNTNLEGALNNSSWNKLEIINNLNLLSNLLIENQNFDIKFNKIIIEISKRFLKTYDGQYKRLTHLLEFNHNLDLKQKIAIKKLQNDIKILHLDPLDKTVSNENLTQDLADMCELIINNAHFDDKFKKINTNVKSHIFPVIPLKYEAQKKYLNNLLNDPDYNNSAHKTKIKKLYLLIDRNKSLIKDKLSPELESNLTQALNSLSNILLSNTTNNKEHEINQLYDIKKQIINIIPLTSSYKAPKKYLEYLLDNPKNMDLAQQARIKMLLGLTNYILSLIQDKLSDKQEKILTITFIVLSEMLLSTVPIKKEREENLFRDIKKQILDIMPLEYEAQKIYCGYLIEDLANNNTNQKATLQMLCQLIDEYFTQEHMYLNNNTTNSQWINEGYIKLLKSVSNIMLKNNDLEQKCAELSTKIDESFLTTYEGQYKRLTHLLDVGEQLFQLNEEQKEHIATFQNHIDKLHHAHRGTGLSNESLIKDLTALCNLIVTPQNDEYVQEIEKRLNIHHKADKRREIGGKVAVVTGGTMLTGVGVTVGGAVGGVITIGTLPVTGPLLLATAVGGLFLTSVGFFAYDKAKERKAMEEELSTIKKDITNPG